MCDKYSGFENYETWNIALWINNDEGLLEYAQKCETPEQLKELMEEETELLCPDIFSANLAYISDIFTAAWQIINWQEVFEATRCE